MKIVCVVPAYLPNRVGAWIATHGYLRHLAARGHDVQVRTIYGHDAPRTIDGVHIEGVGAGVHPHLKSADLAISHAGDRMSHTVENARIAGVPHVTIVHSAHQLPEQPDTDLVVYNSAASRDAANWDLPSMVAHPPLRIEDHETERGDYVTLVNMSPEKGGHVLRRIAAFDRHRQFLAVKGGYGAQVRVGTGETNINVTPCVQDMRNVWARTRILLMPSLNESWGMVGVEAMCSGIPVIAHPTAGLQEALGDAGIFVCREDIYGWRREITRLDDPAQYAAAGRAARRRAEQIAGFDDIDRFAIEIETRFG